MTKNNHNATGDALTQSVRCVTRPELRKLLGNISERTLQRMEEVGDAPVKTRLSSGRVGYRVCDIATWLNGRRQVQP